MIIFETDKKPLTYFLDQIENRDLALPDFQRSFVWDPNATRELVVSIIRSFPAGTLLLMQGGADVFAPRAIEQAPSLNGAPSYLVLDGQQRMTSLYQAFSGKGSHRYFLNLQELIDGYDLDEAVEVYNRRRARQWENLAGQASDLMLPLSSLRAFGDWRDEILELRHEYDDDVKKLRRALNEVEKAYVKPVELYQFPVTTLAQTTPVEAVCTIFETLNRTGVKLSVFELLTARAFAHDVQLREMWRRAREQHPILSDFDIDPYYILQVIAVLVRGTPKRSAVLNLAISEVTGHWDSAVRGMAGGLEMLQDECGILTPKWLGYATMLLTLAAVWDRVTEAAGPTIADRRARLKRWFWCSAFSGAYENAPNTVTEQDVVALRRWLDGGDPPSVVTGFSFDADRWRATSYRNRALYRSTIALMMRGAPLDFHEGRRLTKAIIDGESVDDHHIFPRAYLEESGQSGPVDSVLNHTLIDKITNVRIGKKAPSVYIHEMVTELGDDHAEQILASHGLPATADGPLRSDDFQRFLTWRMERLASELEAVTGARVSRQDAGSETDDAVEEVPYVDTHGAMT